MTFYNKNGQRIDKNKWIIEIQKYYYLDGPTYKRRITRRNQSSRYIEKKIERILKNGLLPDNLPLIIAWKIGAVDHRESENQKNIIYRNQFDENFEFPDAFGNMIRAGEIISYCRNNFEHLTEIETAEQLFYCIKENCSLGNRFGIVKQISLIYFFTQGQWPIYDRYAHIALDAILENKKPCEFIRYQQINNWRDYCDKFVNKIIKIFGKKNIPRDIDRSLWVYGHFYKSN